MVGGGGGFLICGAPILLSAWNYRHTRVAGNTTISLFVEIVLILVVHVSSGDTDRYISNSVEAAEVIVLGKEP
jgi:hypothetical protein